jgi:hypothetical protein
MTDTVDLARCIPKIVFRQNAPRHAGLTDNSPSNTVSPDLCDGDKGRSLTDYLADPQIDRLCPSCERAAALRGR